MGGCLLNLIVSDKHPRASQKTLCRILNVFLVMLLNLIQKENGLATYQSGIQWGGTQEQKNNKI